MKKQLLSFLFLYFGLFLLNAAELPTDSLKLHYTFQNVSGNTVADEAGNNTATLHNAATIEQMGDFSVMNLGTGNGYLDMGSGVGSIIASLDSFTIATYLYINESSNITGNGNFAWTFSTHEFCGATEGKYVAYRVNAQRYSLSTGGYSNEKVGIQSGTAAGKGSWHHVAYTQQGTFGIIYIDGRVLKTGTASYKPKDIGATAYNWLGRPHFSGDAYLKGAFYTDFRIYNRTLSSAEISRFQSKLESLTAGMIDYELELAKTNFTMEGLDSIRKNLTLPTFIKDISVSWHSLTPSVVSHNGVVTRPGVGQSAATVTLIATLSKSGKSVTKEFEVTVLPLLEAQNVVDTDLNNIELDTDRTYFLGILPLPHTGLEGSAFTWQSAETEYLTNTGEIIKLPAVGEGVKTVRLTATATYGNVSETKSFDIKINEDEGFGGYLFAYFTGNAVEREQIFFALSADGYNYKALNNGNPVISGSTISDKGGVRDPHILRGHDGKYYMVVTDMKTSEANCNWACNHGIVLLKSDDLVNWTHSKVDIKAKYPGEFGNIDRAWAPQVIYDEEADKYMIYFSMHTSGSYDIIYYAYANAAFTDLESVPQQLFFHPDNKSCIDGDIIYRDGKYNLFFKTEGDGNGIKKAVSDQLTGGYVLQDEYLQQTTLAVEGSCVFRLINQDKYILMYDVYNSGKYEFTESTELDKFTLATIPVSMDFTPRHGTVIPITRDEAERLTAQWGNVSLVKYGTARNTSVKAINVVVDDAAETLYLPVKYGTDLTAFNPQITGAVPGVSVSPEGVQDFTGGAVSYTLSWKGTGKTYSVTAAVNNNPVISSGYFADPEILYSQKTGKFYIYPTSDGFQGWGGYFFNVFSSDDLVNWTNEGRIIDMHTEQVLWANETAWAPCIEEKKINGEYKYFYYFSGGLDGSPKKIGVAVADHPTGPFTVSASPLIDYSPVNRGQQIDPDVFTDPVSGKSYLYWGNGYLVGAELNDDMLSFKTPQEMSPPNFTEAVYVFYRNNKYYFMWSEGNTGNKHYKVRYATADTPLGPLNVPADNIVLELNELKGINGPAHNSVIKLPGKDEWYIVYHRISRPNGITMPAPGNYREVCIDKLEFNEDGSVKKVVPTLEGINPVTFDPNRINETAQPNKIMLYPNPVKNMVNIPQGIIEGKAEVLVVDLSGRIVMKRFITSEQLSFDCSALANGYYIVQVKAGDKTYFAKLNKN